MQKAKPKKPLCKPQQQSMPGREDKLSPVPVFERPQIKGSNKLEGMSAQVTVADSKVNAAAPGPIWTPLIAGTFKPEKVAVHGSDSPMQFAGEQVEVAPTYLFLASKDAGQLIHPNGGEIING
ncbi:MAG: SDR family oxidoreductase [Ferruginibacter sp.]